jgi:hypothetical protein
VQPADETEFKAQVRTMFAGVGISAHDSAERLTERVDAWWTGLQRMSLTQFVRCMEHLLAVPTWPEYLPKKRAEMLPGDMWKIVRELRAGRAGDPGNEGRNVIRDHWRSVIFDYASQAFGYRYHQAAFADLLVQNQPVLAQPLQALITEIEQQERSNGRTNVLDRRAQAKCDELARRNAALRHPSARSLPQPAAEDAGEFAF